MVIISNKYQYVKRIIYQKFRLLGGNFGVADTDY